MADEPRRKLGVEHAGRAHAVARREQQQVAGRRVHHELHRRIGDELGDRADVDVLERVEHGEPLGGRQLEQAGHGAVRPLPHELGVEREPALAAGLGREGLDVGRIPQMLDRSHLRPSSRTDARVGIAEA